MFSGCPCVSVCLSQSLWMWMQYIVNHSGNFTRFTTLMQFGVRDDLIGFCDHGSKIITRQSMVSSPFGTTLLPYNTRSWYLLQLLLMVLKFWAKWGPSWRRDQTSWSKRVGMPAGGSHWVLTSCLWKFQTLNCL